MAKKRLHLLAISSLISLSLVGTVWAAAIENPHGIGAYPTFPNKTDVEQFTFQAKPGTVISDTLTVGNYNDYPITMYLYPIDKIESNDPKAKADFKLENDTQNEIGKWTKMASKEIDMPAKSTQQVNFDITIPPDAAKKTYFGGIAAEARQQNAPNGTVKINIRAITKINLTVTDTPQLIEKLPPPPLFTPTQLYLYISLALFILVLAYFALKSLKAKKHAATHAHEPTHPAEHHHEKK